jgi:predicted PurR-regulated permease PerM
MTDKKQLAQFILSMVLTAIMLYLCWLMFQPFIPIILWSSILVIIFYPVYNKLKIKFNHPVAALITILFTFITFIIPLMLVGVALVSELSSFMGTAIGKIGDEINDPHNGQLMNLYNTINSYVNIQQFVKPEDIKNYLGSLTGTVLQTTWGLLGGAVGFAVSVFLSIFTMYYLFRDGKLILERLPQILPIPDAQAKELIRETSQLINATMKGTLLIAFLQGLLTGLILWFMGVPAPIVLGVIAFIGSLIPFVGTAIVTIPVIAGLVLSGDYVNAAILAVFASLVIGMIDNFLYPKLINRSAKMNELYVFFSVLGGLQIFGLLGLFIGPIILAFAFGMLTVFKGKKINTEEIALK